MQLVPWKQPEAVSLTKTHYIRFSLHKMGRIYTSVPLISTTGMFNAIRSTSKTKLTMCELFVIINMAEEKIAYYKERE